MVINKTISFSRLQIIHNHLFDSLGLVHNYNFEFGVQLFHLSHTPMLQSGLLGALLCQLWPLVQLFVQLCVSYVATLFVAVVSAWNLVSGLLPRWPTAGPLFITVVVVAVTSIWNFASGLLPRWPTVGPLFIAAIMVTVASVWKFMSGPLLRPHTMGPLFIAVILMGQWCLTLFRQWQHGLHSWAGGGVAMPKPLTSLG